MNGHYPKPGGLAAALAVLIAVVLAACSPKGAAGGDAACGLSDDDFRTEGILQAIPVRATFLDEVSWDIPHQNWGVREWDADFRAMKNVLAGRNERALYKMVVNAATDQVVGLHMIGPDAPEILQAAAVAVKAGLTKADFDATVALHPSMAEELVLLK